MNDSSHQGVRALLEAQCRHQMRLARRRMPWWILSIFVVGLAISALGLVLGLAASEANPRPVATVVIFLVSTIYFALAVGAWVVWPFLIRPRIVPYFQRELGPLWGDTMTAFFRGRGLWRDMDTLDQLAVAFGVTPLSTFGFAYDYDDQVVTWHPASDGLRTAEALLKALSTKGNGALDVRQDLEALALVLRAAVDRQVDFSLVVRLQAKDSVQGVCTREIRQGSFW